MMDFPGFLNDIIFKCVFGTHDSDGVLRPLLNALLERNGEDRLVKVTVSNPTLPRGHRGGKSPVLDVVAADDQGRQYNIEVQLAEQARFKSRSLYYLAKLHGNQLRSGERYEAMGPTIGVCLLGYTLFASRARLHSVYRLLECSDGDELGPDLEIHFFEVAKFHEMDPRKLRTSAEKWIHVLKYLEPGIRDLAPELKAEEGVEMAIERAREAMSDEEVRIQLEMQRKAEHDEATRIHEATQRAVQQGLQQGLQQGRTEGHLEVARRMLEQGYDRQTVARLTGVPEQDLRA
jgi:predicted transposase/invertase (TIGR01784 family)